MKYENIHQDLINGCLKGDEKAQFEIYKLYYKAMYNISLRMINDSMEAEDIMQEAFLAAFSKISSYNGDVSFGAWLKKIVINKSLDYLKKNKRAEFKELDNNVGNITDDDYEKPDNENSSFKINQIKNAISQLADGYRIILSLYLLEGYDHEEIGEILHISSSTSRSQFTRARRKLIEELNKESFSVYEQNM